MKNFFMEISYFKIKNSDKLYKFFQTNKKYRKEIKEIKYHLNINLLN